MAAFRTPQCQDGDKVLNCYEINEDAWAFKDALENLNTRKSTLKDILTGIFSKKSENSELKPNLKCEFLSVWSS